MAFVSELIGKIVTDVDGERVGTLKDLLAVMVVKNTHPQITAIVVKERSADRIISIGDVVKFMATEQDLMGENIFCTSLAGEELGRMRSWGPVSCCPNRMSSSAA